VDANSADRPFCSYSLDRRIEIRESGIMDFVFLGIVGGFAAVTALFVVGCDRLRGGQ